MSKVKHTALPWEVDERFKTLVKGAPGYSVATTGGYSNNTMDPDELNDMLEANAALIVHCVNNFERVVEALDKLHRDSLSSFDYRGSPRCAEVDALLAELEGLTKEGSDE